MDALLLSTYDLGRQPQGPLELADYLIEVGVNPHILDLSAAPSLKDQLPKLIEDLPPKESPYSLAEIAGQCGVVVVFLNMLTSAAMAIEVVSDIARVAPTGLRIAFSGLYAPLVGSEIDLGGRFETYVDQSGDFGKLAAWVAQNDLDNSPKRRYRPRRELALGLSNYRDVTGGGATKAVGSVETTTGCRHYCRHCPIPIVAKGRIRIHQLTEIQADIDALVKNGARHISFGDPDFFNAPVHGLRVLQGLHLRHPELTFDATIKVEHLLRHAQHLPTLKEYGATYIVSAFESLSDTVLKYLNKGHTRQDIVEVLDLVDEAGIDIHPSFVPFTPWTTMEDLIDIATLVKARALDNVVEPVQMGIRLLIPPGSLLLEEPSSLGKLGDFDAATLSWRWSAPEQRLDTLQQEIARLAEDGADNGVSYAQTHELIRQTIARYSGVDFSTIKPQSRNATPMTSSESWFCCAEPTPTQRHQIRETLGEISEIDGECTTTAPTSSFVTGHTHTHSL